ncbi:MAG: hypothetical protein LUH08_02530 [Ruminococcus sp.]|nr:hypothetical protein [Ruminococcus sp.]
MTGKTIGFSFLGRAYEAEVVNQVPPNYEVWNIKREYMPIGYLIYGKLKAEQQFEGGREIDITSLKAIKVVKQRSKEEEKR